MKIQLLKKLAPLLLVAGPYGTIILAVKHHSHNPLATHNLTKKNEDLRKSDEDKKVDNSETKVDGIDPIKQPDESTKPDLATAKAELEDAKSTVEAAKTTLQQQLSTMQTELATSKTGGGAQHSEKATQLEEKIKAIQSRLDNKTDEDKSLTVLSDKKHLLIEAFWKQNNNFYDLFSQVIKNGYALRLWTSWGWKRDFSGATAKDRLKVLLDGHNLQFYASNTNNKWDLSKTVTGSVYHLWDNKGGRKWAVWTGKKNTGGKVEMNFYGTPNITKIDSNITVGEGGYLWSYIGVKLELTGMGGKKEWIAIGVDNSEYQGVDDSGKAYTGNARADLRLHASRLGPQQNTIHRLLGEYQEAVVKHNNLFNTSIKKPVYNVNTNGFFDWVNSGSENSAT